MKEPVVVVKDVYFNLYPSKYELDQSTTIYTDRNHALGVCQPLGQTVSAKIMYKEGE